MPGIKLFNFFKFLIADDTFLSSWFDLQLPEAEVLILNLRSKNCTLPQFMNLMDKLKVLIVTNYSFSPAVLNNFQVAGSLSSLKRIRFEHISISSSFCTASAVTMLNLQKISLTMCEIGNALDNCADMFPNLVEIEIEYCRDLVKLPAGLCDNVHLKKISITSCNELSTLPEEIGRLINLQSLRLNSCTRLEVLPETMGCLQELSLLDVSDCISLSKLPRRIGDLRGLRTLHMRGCWGLFELPPSAEELDNLMVFCDKQTAALWKYYRNVDVILVKEDINLNWLHN